MKKRMSAFFLAVMMVIGMIPFWTISASAEPVSVDVTVKSPIFANTDTPLDLTVPFDFDWLTEGDNTAYNSDLAAFSALASTDVYFREKDEGTPGENKVMVKGSEDPYDCTSFLSAFGFEDVCRIETYDKTSTDPDKNDSATFLAGHRLVDGEDVFVFAFRGAYSSGEWLSMFEVGDPSTIDAHPNWTDPNVLKSIDVAANVSAKKIEEYIQTYGAKEAPDRILLTGHSRGGAIANELGAKFEKDAEKESYTYTFSSPGITLAPDAANYQTIFNINNSDDFFENFLPFEEEAFARYGIDLEDSYTDNSELKQRLQEFGAAGVYACMSEADRELYRTLFSENFKDRAAIYQQETETLTFDNAADAQSYYDACNTVITGFKLGDLCSAELNGNSVRLTTSRASLLKSYSMVLAYGTPDMVDYVKTLFPDDEIAELLYENLASLTNAHRILKSYLLCQVLRPDVPDTGDTGSLCFPVLLLCVSAAGFTVCLKRLRSRR